MATWWTWREDRQRASIPPRERFKSLLRSDKGVVIELDIRVDDLSQSTLGMLVLRGDVDGELTAHLATRK